MEPDRDTLNAFVDGELPPKEMERIAALLAERPDLDRYVREQERLRATLRDAYPLEPAPERLVRAVRTTPAAHRGRLREVLARRFSIRILAPAAAALAVGVVVGLAFRPSADFGTDASGRLVAEGALGKALTTELASNGYRGTGARIGISFRNKAGYDCRTFTNRDDAGLACKEGGSWVVVALAVQKAEHPEADYRMAAAAMPEAVRRAVTAGIDGAPFDAAAEKAARDRGWSGAPKK